VADLQNELTLENSTVVMDSSFVLAPSVQVAPELPLVHAPSVQVTPELPIVLAPVECELPFVRAPSLQVEPNSPTVLAPSVQVEPELAIATGEPEIPVTIKTCQQMRGIRKKRHCRRPAAENSDYCTFHSNQQ
jgi:hypothetical protein